MSSRGPYRRHAPEFKIQLCQDIRGGAIGRRDAARKYALSTNLIQLWLTQYDRGELGTEEAEASVVAEYEAKIAAHERKVGQLTMEPDLVKKTATPAPRERQRELVDRHRPEACSIRRGCQVIELPRSTFHYRTTAASECLNDGRSPGPWRATSIGTRWGQPPAGSGRCADG